MKNFLLAAFLGLFISGCGGGEDAPPAPKIFSVTYKVTAGFFETASANITYQNNTGGTAQETVKLPWSKTMSFAEGDFLYISAQTQSKNGSVTSEITIDGKRTFKIVTSTGPFVIATASGTCCN